MSDDHEVEHHSDDIGVALPTEHRLPHRSHSSSSSSSASSNQSSNPRSAGVVCEACEKEHLPRRLVICVDGTWMVPDGTLDSFEGNASNMFRLWCMVKDGKVQDRQGKTWLQIRAPFIDGIGTAAGWLERRFTGATGIGMSGYESKIKQVYKLCCSEICAKDEIFMFGFSRGSFVVRAVAGLLHHMKALRPDIQDFDETFLKGLSLYRAARDKSKLQENSVFRHISENTTRQSPSVKFLGLIDTVKALDDDNLHDIGLLKSVRHVRHALALFEKRTLMSPERINFANYKELQHLDNSFQEAWFAGTHKNVGGACKDDGLALWPLHWLTTEAKNHGLSCEFRSVHDSNVTDPAGLIMVREGDNQREFVCKNGIRVSMTDLSRSMVKDGFLPLVNTNDSSLPSPTEFRKVFQGADLIGYNRDDPCGTFIHPSVFLFDDTNPQTIHFINNLPFRRELRNQRKLVIRSRTQEFWNPDKLLGVHRAPDHPRILVCGQTNAGKTTLIERVTGKVTVWLIRSHNSHPHEKSKTDLQKGGVSHGILQGDHNIDVEIESQNVDVIIHDSQGFESGKEDNYKIVQGFLERSRAQPYFQNQVHCVWFCASVDVPRIQSSDRKFAKLEFGGVPVILVFTKSDKLLLGFKESALEEYNTTHDTSYKIEDIGTLPNDDKGKVLSRADDLLEQEKQKRIRDWNRKLPIFAETIFVGNLTTARGSVGSLLEISKYAMTSDRMAQVHRQAQDVFVNTKLNASIASIIKLYREKGHIFKLVTDSNESNHKREIVSLAIKDIVAVFKLTGSSPSTFYSILCATLWPELLPLESQYSSSILHELAGWFSPSVVGVGGAVAVGVLAHAIMPAVVATAGFNVIYRSFKASSMSLILIAACLDVLLVVERLFWFGREAVDEHLIRAAALHYLKRREDVHEKLTQKLAQKLAIDLPNPANLPSSAELEPVLSQVVEECKYGRPA